LFEKMVIEPASILNVEDGYGASANVNIIVKLPHEFSAPFLLNREVQSGYWDDPIKEFSNQAHLNFVSFFNWGQLDDRDNGLVLVEVAKWDEQPHTVGKRALVERVYVVFCLASVDEQ
jgi:hypothetical protein